MSLKSDTYTTNRENKDYNLEDLEPHQNLVASRNLFGTKKGPRLVSSGKL